MHQLNKQTIKQTNMKAFIDICPKSHKGGQIFINDQVQNIEDCHAWFDLNLKDMEKVARRKSIEKVTFYVKEGYNVIDSYTIFNEGEA